MARAYAIRKSPFHIKSSTSKKGAFWRLISLRLPVTASTDAIGWGRKIIPHLSQLCQELFFKKIFLFFYPKRVDNKRRLCYTTIVLRGTGVPTKGRVGGAERKKFQKSFKKTLTNKAEYGNIKMSQGKATCKERNWLSRQRTGRRELPR